MKVLVSVLAGLLVSANAMATADANTYIYLVSQEIQSGEFFVEKAPAIGCYGTLEGPALAQFTAEYKVPSNIGCGSTQAFADNINYLVCAKMDYTYDANTDKISVVELDISKCDEKENPDLIRTIKKAVKLNFTYSKSKVVIKK